MSASSTAPGRRALVLSRPSWLAPLLLFLAAALLYCIGLDDGLAIHDEIHHLLAARGLLESGEPRLAEGFYRRGLLYTWMVAQSYRLLGDGLFAGRLPAVLAGAMLVALLFVWLRREAGARAAWLAALLFAVSPFAIETAQFARFYALQSLVFLAAALALYEALLVAGSTAGRLFWLAVAAAGLALAVDLQTTSALGVVGLGLWAALAVGVPWLCRAPPRQRRLALAAAAILVALSAAALAGLWQAGEIQRLWLRYSNPLADFQEADAGKFWFYHVWYALYYPTLWPAVGLLALIGIAAWPRPGLLALLVFAPAFLLNSLAGPKGVRYMAYAQPFLFVVWGLGLAALWQPVGAFLGALATRLALLSPLPRPWALRLGRALLAGAVLFLVLANLAWLRSVAMLADVTLPGEVGNIHYDRARPALAPLLERADIVLTTSELETLYYLGRYDVLLNRSRFSELLGDQRGRELGRDYRTGRPVISTRQSVALLMDCFASGLIVSNRKQWGHDFFVDAPTAALITARAQPVPLPPGSGVLAWAWSHPAAAAPPAACAGLDFRRGPG